MIARRSLCPEKLGILVRAVKGLISRAGMVSICPLLWQRDVKLQQTKPASPDGWAVWSAIEFTHWWLLVDHCVLRNWDRILVRAVKGLISRAGMVSICPLLWQRDVKTPTNQQTKPTWSGGIESNQKPVIVIMSPEGGTYSFCSCSRAAWCVMRDAWGVRCPQLTLSDHLKKKLFRYLHNFFFYMSMVSIARLVLIFSNFWKTRWPPQPFFCWLRILMTSDQLKEKLWIYLHQTFHMDIRWLVLIFNNFWKTRWPPQPISCWLRILTTSDQLKEKLWIYLHQTFYMDIRWHKLGWYWFSAIFEKQDGHHSLFFADSEYWRRPIN